MLQQKQNLPTENRHLSRTYRIQSTLDPYLLYVNPYFVVRHYHNWKEASKHYYMGSQRIASELMGAPFDADDLADNPLEGPGGEMVLKPSPKTRTVKIESTKIEGQIEALSP